MTSTTSASEYVTSTAPGGGLRAPARSHLRSDAPSLSLNGTWDFRLFPSVAAAERAEAAADAGTMPDWETIDVPSHWVLTGDIDGDPASPDRGLPIYTNVQFPFPTEPPFVPDENPTADYRRTFELPAGFPAGDTANVGRTLLRFDGVESRYRVNLNGHEIGWGAGSRLAQEFDVTDALRAGSNTIEVRVHQWSASSYVEDQDQWWLPGIFRDVTLLARPAAGIDDAWLRCDYAGPASGTGPGLISPEVTADASAYPVTLTIPELDIAVTWARPEDVAPVAIPEVEPWSAEVPRLYDATLAAANAAETLAFRLGFRTVRIDGDRFLVNGERVVFHGMNRHEVHPDRGRVFDRDDAREDLLQMKRFNVNAIRTSHYPPHPELLELADELGFWVVLECDLETHGFQRDGWVGNPSDDPAWHDAYVDRMVRTLERDKNHPSIVMWSLGNESHTGRNLAAMAAFVHDRDPGRPVHYEGDYTGEYTDVYSRMYPYVDEWRSVGAKDAEATILWCTPSEAQRNFTKPAVLCEYVHAMGNGPGGVADYEDLVDEFPSLHGGFVWEWRDHGLHTRTPDGTRYLAYGGDFAEELHDGNFNMDGIVYSDGTPSPGLHEWAQVCAPIRLTITQGEEAAEVLVENRRHSAAADDIDLRWSVTRDGVSVAEGAIPLADIDGGAPAAGEMVMIMLDVTDVAPGAETWLTVEAVQAADTPWAPAGWRISAAQLDLTPVSLARTGRALPAPDGDHVEARVEMGPAVFEHGRLVELAGRPVAGPRLELFRAPTDNDRGAPVDPRVVWGPQPVGERGDLVREAVVVGDAQQWLREGLDRLHGRVEFLRATADRVSVRTRWAAANSKRSVVLTEHWTLAADGSVALDAHILPSDGWDIPWPRAGVRFDLPVDVEHASWFGTGPMESYPDTDHAAFVGLYHAEVDDLVEPYGRPQESGHRSAVRRLDLDLVDWEPWLYVETERDHAGHLPGFTLRRHTAQQVAAAGHPHELPEPTATYLWFDAAVGGIGTGACGPRPAAKDTLRAGAHELHLRFGSR